MIYALSIAFWAIWRRWLGLGSSGPRWAKVAVAGVAIIGSVYCVTGFHVDAILWTVGLLAFAAIYFLPAHKYHPEKDGFKFWHPGYWGYVIAWKLKDKLPTKPPVLDGWSAYGEIWLGGVFGIFLALVYNTI